MMKTTTPLEGVLNIAIALISVMIGVVLWTNRSAYLYSWHRDAEERQIQGQILPPLPGHPWNRFPETLVIALRKGCGHCDANVPFYKALSQLDRVNRLHVHLLAVMPTLHGAGAKLLQSAGLNIGNVVEAPLKSIKVTGTPTLFLLDAQGRVKRAWIGELPPHRQKEVLSVVETVGNPPGTAQ